MQASQWAVWATVAVVIAVTVASGPLVGAVDLAHRTGPTVPPGRGTAAVHLVDAPRTATLEAGDFGSGTYHLVGSPARVRVGDVRGDPVLEYVVRVPGIGLTDVHEYHPRETPHRTVDLRYRPVEVSPRLVGNDTYAGTLEVRLQADDYRLLYEGDLTVEVAR